MRARMEFTPEFTQKAVQLALNTSVNNASKQLGLSRTLVGRLVKEAGPDVKLKKRDADNVVMAHVIDREGKSVVRCRYSKTFKAEVAKFANYHGKAAASEKYEVPVRTIYHWCRLANED